MALIAPGLQEQPDAVANPWRLIIQESEQASAPLPVGTRIVEVYDAAGGELLILGEPGAGKTTLLLELGRDLLSRAERDPAHPIPVVFNLSSWVRRKRQSLVLWLREELETKYHVPRSVGSDWISSNQILPLLDGLDEVDASSLSACIQAINDYHQGHSLVPLVICCRVSDYRSQANQLELFRAVAIQPLTTEQITAYFEQIGERVASLRIAFTHDPVLQELATTPLMLTILILTYQDASLEKIEGDGSAEVRKSHIFATYTQRMLRRRKAGSRYSPEQTISWLSHLARQMKHRNQTIFFLEHMQPDWLMKKWQRRLYYGLITGPICGLFVGLAAVGTILSFPLVVLITAFLVGLLFGWGSELETEHKGTETTMPLWMRIRESLTDTLENRTRIGVATGLFIGTGSFLYLYLGDFSSGHWEAE
jgi:DNA polymerase III delta prime subunit